MTFTLLKVANANLSQPVITETAIVATTDVEALALHILKEGADTSQFEITPDDYSQWLQVILDVAAEQNIPVGRRSKFMDVALDYVLDNDPKIDAIGSDDPEELKGKIASTLWQTYKASKAHSAVSAGVSGTIKRAQEEEETFAQLSSNIAFRMGQHAEVLVGSKHHPCMIIKVEPDNKYTIRVKLRNRTMDIEHVPGGRLRAAQFQDEESGFEQAFNVASGAEDEQNACPYPSGTLRAAIWHDYNKPKQNQMRNKFAGVEEEQVVSFDQFNPGEDEFDEPEDSAADIASRIVDDEDLESRIADLETRLADLEGEDDTEDDEIELDKFGTQNADGTLDIDYDSLGNDRGGAAQVIGVSVPATAREEEEDTADMFRQAITAPRSKLSDAVKSVEQEGNSAWKGLQLPRNPHPKQSQAHKAWERGMKNAARDALGLAPKPDAKPPTKSKRK